MTKKCCISFVAFLLLSAICLVSMHLMLLADVNKYVGVGVGGGILLVAFILYIVFYTKVHIGNRISLLILASAIGDGLAISSLYVYMGTAPKIIESLCIFGAYAVLFLVYCLLANLSLFRRFPRVCLTVYGLLVLTGGIIGAIFSSTTIFSLALMMFIPFISYLATVLASSKNYSDHINTLVLVSFMGLLIVVIVVLVVISEGDGLDGGGFADGSGGSYKNGKNNPYDFVGKV